jgi:hypothetical protein
MNEPSSLPSPTQSTTPLRSLQEILHNRIIQKKGEIHKSHNRAYNDKPMDRDRNIAMDIGSNTNAAETITSRAKSHFL